MGRHETFENAAPIAEALLAGTMLGRTSTTVLPEPGSQEAKDAFAAACREHSARTTFANGYPELKRTPLQWWTTSCLSRALETGELTPVEVAHLYPLASERELRLDQVGHDLNLGTLHALAFADEYPHPVDDDEIEVDLDADADAALLRLGREFDAAVARENELNVIARAAANKAAQHMPDRPAALLFRDDDRPFRMQADGGHGAPLVGAKVEWRDIEALRGRVFTRRVERPVRPEDKLPSDARTVVEKEPWPEAQARADEIMAAWDGWHDEQHRVRVEHNEIAADEAADAAGLATQAIMERIATERATTAEGFRVKLRAMFVYDEDGEGSETTVGRIQRSLLRDVRDSDAHRSASATPKASPVDEAAPLDLAAACDWAVAHMAWINDTSHPDREWPDERLNGEIERFDAVLDRAADEPSTGLGDLTAKARLVLCEWRTMVSDKNKTSGEAALVTLLQEVAALDPNAPQGVASTPDPVFAAITASRRAEAEMKAFGADPCATSRPGWLDHEEALAQVQRRTRDAVWSTVPTTHAGRLALVDYAHFQAGLHEIPSASPDVADLMFKEVVGALSAAIRGERSETTAIIVPDIKRTEADALAAAILDLWPICAAQEGEGTDEQNAANEEMERRRSGLLDAAAALPATPETIHAKALALAWIEYVDLWHRDRKRDDYATDGQLAVDIHLAALARATPPEWQAKGGEV